MITTDLLATKFFVPAPPRQAVPRIDLLARLDTVIHQPLVLVSAPAGYGKSTFVVQWLKQQRHPFAWLSLEESDNQPVRFFTYFIAALRRLDESFCGDLFATLQSGQFPPVDTLLAALVNAILAWETSHFLVLDDFHHIQDAVILESLNSLLTQSPPNFHLVLVTREDPPLPLARMRARGQLIEIRAADLRFSEIEANCLLREGLLLDLSPTDVASLIERTEGWAAGLKLAGISLQGRDNPGSFVQNLSGRNRFILDYLTEEALKTQPPDVQDFLLETSILPRFCGDLCDAVTGRSNSAALLESLLAANLFIIPLDDEGHWYRYHHLFSELLQHKMRRERAVDLPQLHRRTSHWHEAQGDIGEAVEHASHAGDFARMANLMGRSHWDLINRGYARTMERWLQQVPDDLRQNCPQIYLSIVWGQLLRGDFSQAAANLQLAQAGLANLPSGTPASRAAQSDYFVLQSTLAQVQGRLPEALERAEQARRLVPDGDIRLSALTSLAFGAVYRQMGAFEQAREHLLAAIQSAGTIDDHTTAMVAMAHLSLMLWPLGRLREVARIAEQVIARSEAVSGIAPLMIGAVYAVLGQIYYEWDQLEKAREVLLHGIRLASLSGHTASLVYGKVHLAHLLQGQGDLENAAQQLAEAEEVLTGGAPAWVRPDWLAQKVRLLVMQGKLEVAEAALRTSGIPAEAPVTYRTDVIHLAWLRWMVATGHRDAFTLAERIVESAESEDRNGTLIHALVLGARVGGGAAWLERARQLGAPQGYQRVFSDEAFADQAIPSNTGVSLAGKSLALGGTEYDSSFVMVEPLTEREMDVLHLLAGGLTYAQIAERLFVSINTVRFHVKGIYGKLGVEKQTQAVERGRALGLI